MHERMKERGPQIIGIAGGSCAGKSWLADRLAGELGDKAVRISLDSFYLEHSHLSVGQRARINFDHPRAVDWFRFEQTMRCSASRRPVSVPHYDFATHARNGEEKAIGPAPVVIVDGLWSFR